MKLKMRRYGDYESDNTGVGDTGQRVVRRYAMIQEIIRKRPKIRENKKKYKKILENIRKKKGKVIYNI